MDKGKKRALTQREYFDARATLVDIATGEHIAATTPGVIAIVKANTAITLTSRQAVRIMTDAGLTWQSVPKLLRSSGSVAIDELQLEVIRLNDRIDVLCTEVRRISGKV